MVDILIAVIAVALAVWGFQQGLVVSLALAGGFLGGAVAGSRLAEAVLSSGAESPYAPLIALVCGLLLGAVAAAVLDAPARSVQGRIIRGRILRTVDGVGGAALLGAVAVGFAWVAGLAALNTPELSIARGVAQDSVVLQRISEAIPPHEDPLRFGNEVDDLPELAGPEPRTRSPLDATRREKGVARGSRSTLRVSGTACGLRTAGSGWPVRRRLVVTSAHVIAGQEDTTVIPRKGPERRGVPVYFDADNDLAILRVKPLRVARLRQADHARRDAVAAAVGYRTRGSLEVEPARVGRLATLPSEDAYGEGPTIRRMLSFRANVAEGYSGGPLVDRRGRVLGTIFARLDTDGPPSGLAVPNKVVREALGKTDNRADTGDCAG